MVENNELNNDILEWYVVGCHIIQNPNLNELSKEKFKDSLNTLKMMSKEPIVKDILFIDSFKAMRSISIMELTTILQGLKQKITRFQTELNNRDLSEKFNANWLIQIERLKP